MAGDTRGSADLFKMVKVCGPLETLPPGTMLEAVAETRGPSFGQTFSIIQVTAGPCKKKLRSKPRALAAIDFEVQHSL